MTRGFVGTVLITTCKQRGESMFTQEDILGLIKTNELIYKMGLRDGEEKARKELLNEAEKLAGAKSEN